jgi:hypothetical protein
MDLAFLLFFFLKHPLKQVFREKEKGEKNCGCLGEKNDGSLSSQK